MVFHHSRFPLIQRLQTNGIRSSIFVNKSTRLIVSVYVDDIQIFGPRGSKEIHILKEELHKKFAMTDLGPCLYFLSI